MRLRIVIDLRDWLRLLARVTGRIRRALLSATLRRKDGARLVPTPDEQTTGLTAEARLGEHDLSLMATTPLCVSPSYEDWLARQELSPDSPPDARLFFPLAEYEDAILPGLAPADEWIHYLSVDRRLALDLYCPTHASPPASDEDEDVLVIHAVRAEPHASAPERPA